MDPSQSNAPDSSSTNAQKRRESFASNDSQTAKDYIESQLRLEADAREALPYAFDSCTKQLGALRQSLFSCLTCNPPPSDPSEPYQAAGVCYSCSISCHGEHTLVELFSKRNFVCDCGTTRLPATSPCTLRTDEKTGNKGVHSEEPASDNKYNQNFRNRFCGCGETYDPHQEKGTMFQCLGLGTVETGGCGEDWWHPECLVGLPRKWIEVSTNLEQTEAKKEDGSQDVNPEVSATADGNEEEASDDPPLPPGFPDEDDFETFICYKCLDSNPWLKRYAGTTGFLPPVYKGTVPDGTNGDTVASEKPVEEAKKTADNRTNVPTAPQETAEEAKSENSSQTSKKRKLEDDIDGEPDSKRTKEEPAEDQPSAESSKPSPHKHDALPVSGPLATFSLFVKEDFREHICHCPTCFPLLVPHPQLREEEETYEPPLSESGDGNAANGSQHTGSLLDRGEAALSNVDRVRAIEGVMVYNHLKDKVKEFLKPFAESGTAVGAEDIKAYFEKLRGDDQAISEARRDEGDGGEGGDNRREQSGY